ncbi:MAG: phage exclusion protein Lit family protein [Limisphaerales bacterium]
MQSPIRHLMADNLPNSVFTIAPERKAEFDTSLNDFDLIYVSQRRWKFCAYPERTPSEVWVSRGAVELIWCASLAHFLFYTRLIQRRKFDRPTEIDPHSDPVVSKALLLLSWAIKCQLEHDEADNWPPGMPCPLQSPASESDENVADELCLVSCAYFLHHELAHIRNEHDSISQQQLENPEMAALSLSQEKEADIEAAEWVLDGIGVESSMFVKRMLGIVQGFLLTTAMGLYGGNLGGKTHPFSYDRLTSLLSRFLGNAPHITKGIAFAVLDLHFQNSGRTLQKQAFADPEEALEALCNQLAAEVHARPTGGANK